MRTAKIGFILSMLALSCFLSACAETGSTVKPATPAGKKTTIRIGSPFKGGIVVEAAEKFKELVEKGSGGRFEVKIDAGTKAEIDINKLNRAGELEMQSNGTNFLELYAPPYYFFTGPYVMKDFDHYMRAWNGKLGQEARAQLEKNDLLYLATLYRGLRQMTTKTPGISYGILFAIAPAFAGTLSLTEVQLVFVWLHTIGAARCSGCFFGSFVQGETKVDRP